MRNTNILIDAQNKYWWSYTNRTIEAACLVAGDPQRSPSERNQMLQELTNSAFYAGAKWNMKQTSELSPHIAKFIEMMILLGFLDQD